MRVGQLVEFNLEEGATGLIEIPDCLMGHSYEVIGNIMYSVSGLLDKDLGISNEDMASSFQLIISKGHLPLWSLYFQETMKRRSVQIH